MDDKSLAHYRIGEKLGEGGMGEVYAAEDTKLGRQVALKILPEKMAGAPERLERFEREAKAVAALNHPNIVTIHSVEEAGGHHFITMELVEGKTLAELLLKGALPLDSFLEVALSLTDALNAAHGRGITHRDLKPANVMVGGEDGRIKVLDFGLSKIRGLEQPQENTVTAAATLTQQGVILGTVPYMSPEQLQGKPVDHRSDIFSLGIMLYEMATGRRPFQGETSVDLISSILRDVPRPVTEVKVDLPRDLGRIVRRCLEKDPQRRYQSVQDIRTELQDLDRESAKTTTTTPSIAVLPFVDMSPEGDQEYFCDGIAEELINALIKAGGLRIPSRTSAFGFKGKDLNIQEIGKELNVETVLEGSVRKAGNRLRINARLGKVADGYQLWAETFDREMEDVFAIQDEIARNISRALKGVLTDQDEASTPKAPTENVKAYEYYLRGRQLFHNLSRPSLERARRLFKRACELDPNYANAWAGIADCCSLMYMYWDATEAQLQEAEAASQKALELDSDAAESHVARGLAVSLNQRYDEATREFEHAIELNPELFEALYFYARTCVAHGKREQAATLFEQACRQRPEDYVAPNFLGALNATLGRKNESEAAYRRSLEAAERHLDLFPEEPRALYMGANALAILNEDNRARDWAERATLADPEEPVVLYNVACTFAKLGDVDKAIDCLDEAITFGMGQKDWFEHDADLDVLRDNPRFDALLERL
ncbi:MAG: protein kinase [Acidobacteria bacterium]|nr:protein kinase [Acidobacteriota bacterium]NIM60723.1 protein kinase [Acidobacteriota bacterium]NIO59543.1 protein kinase [Acidobacteriota bacterium]NIQ30564.1 protein kinase [Acidobacteriota bacterium]NIQ85529.1 protein kinase [Acidobacteriota bacterium]